jgi:uncharacterized protein YqeY
MSLRERIETDLKAAMKSRDHDTVGALRMALAAIKTAAAEGGTGGEVSDERVEELLHREVKQRRESADAYEEGGRDDLAAKERREAEVLEAYLPEQLGEEELAAVVDETIAEVGASDSSDVGRVMGEIMPKIKGRADGKAVNAKVRERLGG